MYKSIGIFCGALVISLGIVVFGPAAFAQLQSASTSTPSVSYPIAELGNCSDQKNCEAYCEQVDHMQTCISFARKNAMLSKSDLDKSERVIKRITEGKTPGQCKTRGECESFCRGNTKNMKACVSFAEEMNILPPAELAQAKKVAQALEGGAKLPGTCTDKQSCDTYCAMADHLDECLNFAEKADLIPASDIAEARKVAGFLKDGTTPGACKSKEECKNYCADGAHFNECINFAEKAGLATKEDVEMAKKTGGKGPGGCKSKEECNAYCEDQAHIDECVQFGISTGVLTKEQIDNIQNGVERIQKGLEGIDPEARAEVEACFASKLGADTYQKIMAKEIKMTQKMGESIQSCFESTMKNYAEKIKAKMMKEGGIPGGMPKGIPESMRQQIPESMRNQIPGGAEGSIPEGIKQQIPQGIMPQGIPESIRQQIPEAGGASQPISGAVSPQMIQGGAAPAVSCDMFTQVPSCDMIPDPRGVDACKKCKQ